MKAMEENKHQIENCWLKIVKRVFKNTVENSSCLRTYSIVSPSVLHRYSIGTMDHRWSIDGESMEYLPCFWV